MALILMAGTIDSYRFFNNKKPLFILKTTQLLDGGTTFYHGPGYEFVDWNILGYDNERNRPFNYTKKEVHVIPFFITNYSLDRIDTDTFERQYQ